VPPHSIFDVVVPDAVLTGIDGITPVTVERVSRLNNDSARVLFSREDGSAGSAVVYDVDLPRIHVARLGSRFSFDGSAEQFWLAAETRRMRTAYLFDPHTALGTSDVRPLPHQLRAVYQELLPRHPLRYLLADDPGAGKTIMAGLYVKELILRGDASNVLVVAPGSLVDQWQDELSQKFSMTFEQLSRDRIVADGNPFTRGGLWIARLDVLARNSQGILDKALECEWDLVIADEAHKASASVFGGEVKKTKRYQMFEQLGGKSRNLLLMTATPHSGKEEQFQLFMALLDSDRFEDVQREGTRHTDTSDLMRRLVKEELLTFEGTRLFPERQATTVQYELTPDEQDLYVSVTEYVSKEMDRVKRASGTKRVAVGFALTTLQRRLASSPRAICRSLERRLDRLKKQLEEARMMAAGSPRPAITLGAGVELGDDFDEDDLTEDELIALEEGVASMSAAQTIPELETEIMVVEELVEKGRRLRSSPSYSKWDRLRDTIDPSQNEHMNDGTGNRRKMIIFTEHRDTLDDLVQRLRAMLGREDAVTVIHGGVRREERRKAVETFRNVPECVFLVATDAAGEGVNLQNAHLLINFDLPWNPNRIEQRFGRVHRIGQEQVCHMWSMVAKDTREGDVYRRLLEKLEEQRQALGGRVYDVLGRVFDGTSLRDLMLEAIEYGDDPARRQELFAVIDQRVGDGLAEILAQDSLVTSTLDTGEVASIRREMERAEAARVQPYHVEALFKRAFESLGGRLITRDGGRRHEIRNVPAAILERDRVVGRGKAVVKAYSRITFDQSHVRVEGQTIDAELIYPGHPLMTAVMDLTAQRCRESLSTGAILIDPSDLSLHPYIVAMLEHDITDGTGTVVSKRGQYVRVDPDGTVHALTSTPLPNLTAPGEVTPELEPLRTLDWLTLGAFEQQVIAEASATLAKAHTYEVTETISTRISKQRHLIDQRLYSAITHYDHQAYELRQREEAGEKTRLSAANAADRAESFRQRRTQRLAILDREAALTAGVPTITSAMIVVPHGWLDALIDPVEAEKTAVETEFVERCAVDAVLAIERGRGHHPIEMARNNPGYDIESDTPDGLDFIEVKGRIAGATDFTITRTEIVTLKNMGDRGILALGRVRPDGQTQVKMLRDPFPERHVDEADKKIVMDWTTYWNRAEKDH